MHRGRRRSGWGTKNVVWQASLASFQSDTQISNREQQSLAPDFRGAHYPPRGKRHANHGDARIVVVLLEKQEVSLTDGRLIANESSRMFDPWGYERKI